MPTSFFHLSKAPEIYSVELIDLSEPLLEPQPTQPHVPQAIAKPQATDKPAVSTTPILSTRNIPQTPTKIKILRPRKTKVDLRKNQPPIDQTMVFAALERMQKQEEFQAKAELVKAQQEVDEANADALQALRTSILSRQSPPLTSQDSANHDLNATGNRQQQGLRANTVRSQYIATMGQHIGNYWRLPKGQKWDNRLNTTVIVKIKADGIVLSTKIATSSKSKQFDRFVVETIIKASPLPPIPSELPNVPLKLHFFPKGLQ